MSPLPSIKPGSRAIVAGRTGSGKTTLAAWLIHRNFQRWVILNPKHTAGYKSLDDSVALENFNERKLDRELSRHRFVSLNFSPQENNNEFMDSIIYFLHEQYENIGILCDELYTLHKNGRQGDGLTAWLTRGRERAQTFIGLTQRPAWISRFCFSEADAVGGMALQLLEDRKRMVANTGREEFAKRLDPHEWLWYKVAENQLTHWGPVPMPITSEA